MECTEDPNIYRPLGPIYFSSIYPLLNDQNLNESHKIKTIISVTTTEIPVKYTQEPYTHLQIPVLDLSDSNILKYFDEINRLIDQTIGERGHLTGDAVLVHCQSGVSRSVSIVMEYLMYKFGINLSQAERAIKRVKSTAEPNDGFLRQLNQWSNLLSDSKGNNEEHKAKDERIIVQCHKCRAPLADDRVVLKHEMPDDDDKQRYFKRRQRGDICSHLFVDGVNWMKDKMVEIEGKLDCYKCGTKIGGWSWKGGRCSCGKWMVPDVHLVKSKVIQVCHGKIISMGDQRYL
ncbi:tyrosine protein phosphatase [Martiniozyma asiatica (nom. inval.)]|nr:tyrosine protein phosphatase [Martiniozyma asiatica]